MKNTSIYSTGGRLRVLLMSVPAPILDGLELTEEQQRLLALVVVTLILF